MESRLFVNLHQKESVMKKIKIKRFEKFSTLIALRKAEHENNGCLIIAHTNAIITTTDMGERIWYQSCECAKPNRISKQEALSYTYEFEEMRPWVHIFDRDEVTYVLCKTKQKRRVVVKGYMSKYDQCILLNDVPLSCGIVTPIGELRLEAFAC